MPPHHQAIAHRLFNRRFLFTAIWTGIILFTAIPISGIRLDLQIFYGGIYLWEDKKRKYKNKKIVKWKGKHSWAATKSCLHNYPTQARPLKSSRRKSKPNAYGNPERFPSFLWTMKTEEKICQGHGTPKVAVTFLRSFCHSGTQSEQARNGGCRYQFSFFKGD